jgi:hypothetical protein
MYSSSRLGMPRISGSSFLEELEDLVAFFTSE